MNIPKFCTTQDMLRHGLCYFEREEVIITVDIQQVGTRSCVLTRVSKKYDLATLCSCRVVIGLSQSVWIVALSHLGLTTPAVDGHLACCRIRAGTDRAGSSGPVTQYLPL